MNWRLLRILFFLTLAIAVLAAAVVLWYERERRIGYYTDADTIRQPATDTAPRDVLWQPPRALPPSINTERDDYEPRLTNDGLTLYFVRGRAGEDADICFCRRTSDGWSAPASLDDINTDADELGPEPSPDGDSLYFYSDRTGGCGGYDLWVAHRTNDAWIAPINLGAAVNTPFNEYGPCVSADGRRLIFASNRPNDNDTAAPDPDAWPATVREDHHFCDYDLYVAPVSDRGLGPARPLRELNSPYNEGSPSESPVGDFLYFTSDRPGGQGGFDIYRSRWLRDQQLPPENVGPPVNSSANELDPTLSANGFTLHFSSDRIAEGSGVPAGDDYDVFLSDSREVFIETEAYRASIDWIALVPYAVWLLLVLLLLLLLLLFARLLHSGQYGKLSLLARCVLASALVHVIILILLTFWGVSSSISHWIGERGGTRIALVSAAATDGLAAQIRGDLTGLQIEPPAEAAASHVRHAAPTIMPLAAPAMLEVSRSRLTMNDPPPAPEALPDAPAHELPLTERQSPSPVPSHVPIDFELPPRASRVIEVEAAREIKLTDDLPPNARQQIQHSSGPDQWPSVQGSLSPTRLPDALPGPASPRSETIASTRIPQPPEPALRASRALLPPPDPVVDAPPVPTAPASARAEPTARTETRQAISARHDAAIHPAESPSVDVLIRRIAPPQQTREARAATSSVITVVTPDDSPSAAIRTRHVEPRPELPAIAADTSALPEQTYAGEESTSGPPPSSIESASPLRRRFHRPEPFALDPTAPVLPHAAPNVPQPSRLVTLDAHDTIPDAPSSGPLRRQPADTILTSAAPITIALPPTADETEAAPVDEPTLAVAPDSAGSSPLRWTPDAPSRSRLPASSPRRLDPPSSTMREARPQSLSSFPLTDAAAPRRPGLGLARLETPAELPPLAVCLASAEQSRPATAPEDSLAAGAVQDMSAPSAVRSRPQDQPHVVPQVLLPAAPVTDRAAPSVESSLFTDPMRAARDSSIELSRCFSAASRQPSPPETMVLASVLPVLPDEPPRSVPEPPTVDVAGAVRGVVRDANTGEPLAGVTVRLDLADLPALAVTTGAQGDYLLLTPPVPEFVALSASHDDYVPDTVNIAADELDHAIVTRDFRLMPRQKAIIALESDPDVHHLGDDRFTGRINSQFQKRSEGRLYTGLFELTADQLLTADTEAEIHLLVRGAQRNNRIRINDHLLDTRLNRAPRDGSFGPFYSTFPISWLREGSNILEIESVYGGSDYDDFEFVNIRIRLSDTD